MVLSWSGWKGAVMSINEKEIGQRIRSCRIDLGLSAAQVAEDLNFSVEHYWKLETGNRKQTLEFIASFSNRYHVSADYLIFGQPQYAKTNAVLDIVINLLTSIKSM